MSRNGRVGDSEAFKTHRTRVDQILGTSYGLFFLIDDKKVPTLLITPHAETPVIIELPRLDGTVFQVDASSQALHRSKTLAVKLLVEWFCCRPVSS